MFIVLTYLLDEQAMIRNWYYRISLPFPDTIREKNKKKQKTKKKQDSIK